MKRFLLLALTAGLLSPIAAKAESYWLILTYGMGGYEDSGALEKIEMQSSEACEKEGRKWENSPTHGIKSGFRRFHCVIGK